MTVVKLLSPDQPNLWEHINNTETAEAGFPKESKEHWKSEALLNAFF